MVLGGCHVAAARSEPPRQSCADRDQQQVNNTRGFTAGDAAGRRYLVTRRDGSMHPSPSAGFRACTPRPGSPTSLAGQLSGAGGGDIRIGLR